MMNKEAIFVENQYLGRDKGWVTVRLVLALFCFAAFYINMDREVDRQLFFIAGSAIVLGSIIMMYMLHYRITVNPGHIVLSGLWTTRLVKIDLHSIKKVEMLPYSSFFVNNPVYNLHQKGFIKFYAGGKDAIWLTDKDGLVYLIGTQRNKELYQAILEAKKQSV